MERGRRQKAYETPYGQNMLPPLVVNTATGKNEMELRRPRRARPGLRCHGEPTASAAAALAESLR